MPDVNRGNRPLSPFMMGQYYRPQITSITSILTRITGIALIAEMLLIVLWLVAAATSPACFETMDFLITSWLGDLLMLGSVWALWYHLLAGLRHLYWDTGRGLELETAELLGKALFVGSAVLTVLTVFIFFFV